MPEAGERAREDDTMNIIGITLKLLLAVALGGLIGLLRETSRKPAGFRTNILICIGATMVMILALLVLQGKVSAGSETAQIVAGVIMGIGFIGAGTIIQAKGSVLGLTSAATLWTVAVLGLVIGSGYYLIAVIYTGIIILTLAIFRYVEDQFGNKSYRRYRVTTPNPKQVLYDIRKIAFHEGLKFRELQMKNEETSSTIAFTMVAGTDKEEAFTKTILNLKDIAEIKID